MSRLSVHRPFECVVITRQEYGYTFRPDTLNEVSEAFPGQLCTSTIRDPGLYPPGGREIQSAPLFPAVADRGGGIQRQPLNPDCPELDLSRRKLGCDDLPDLD